MRNESQRLWKKKNTKILFLSLSLLLILHGNACYAGYFVFRLDVQLKSLNIIVLNLIARLCFNKN